MIYARQADYYAVLRECGSVGHSTAFIEFILQVIVDTLTTSDQVTDQVKKLLRALRQEPKSAASLMKALGLSHRPSFRKRYLRPALDAGLIEMTKPETPNATDQRYRRTAKGRR